MKNENVLLDERTLLLRKKIASFSVCEFENLAQLGTRGFCSPFGEGVTHAELPNKWSEFSLLEKFTCKKTCWLLTKCSNEFLLSSACFLFSFPAHKSCIGEGCWPNRTTFSIIYVCGTLTSITYTYMAYWRNKPNKAEFIFHRNSGRVKHLFGCLFGGVVAITKIPVRENIKSCYY